MPEASKQVRCCYKSLCLKGGTNAKIKEAGKVESKHALKCPELDCDMKHFCVQNKCLSDHLRAQHDYSPSRAGDLMWRMHATF